MIDFKGPLMTLLRDGQPISQHSKRIEAMQSALNSAITDGGARFELVTPNEVWDLPTLTVGGDAVEPDPVDPPPADPDPVEPDPTGKPADIAIPIDRGDVFSFGGHFAGGRYNRFQKLTVLKEGDSQVDFVWLSNGARKNIPEGTEFTILADGEPVMTFTRSKDSNRVWPTIPVDKLSNGWHVLSIKDVHCIPLPVFVLHDTPESDWMPWTTTSYELAMSKEALPVFEIKWLPTRYTPVPDPLERREFTPFSDSPSWSTGKLIAAELVKGQRPDVRRPNVSKEGIWSTANTQRYFWYDFVRSKPVYPLLDGPRGVGTIQGATHLQIGTGRREDHPDSPLMGNVYGLDSWRMFRIAPDGEVTTLVGWRTKTPPGEYWKDGQDLELVGDWSAVEGPKGFHEPWGFAWHPITLEVDPDADPIPEESNRVPHKVAPVCFIADTQNNRVLRVEFNATAHGVPPKVTEFLTDLAEAWDCVEWGGKLIVSERNDHRICQYSMETGELERVIVEGEALSHLSSSRWVLRDAELDVIREQPVVGPEGLYVLDDWLYFGSMAMAQVKRVHLVTGEIEHVVDVLANSGTGNKYVKITVSDGAFGPKGTVFVSQWLARAPAAYLPDGTRWNYAQWGLDYDTACAVFQGRFVFGGSVEGVREVRRAA